MEGVEDLNVDLWLQVIPQIIARIHSNVSEISKPLQHLLSRIGKAHPQALVYPLSVASTSISEERRIAAQTAMNNMRQFNETLVNQSELVAKELIRVAILWPEMWHEGLEDASRHYFGDHNVEAMIERILPLQEKLKHPETTQEYAFIQAFEKDLVKAWEYCQRYKRNGDVSNMNKAWDIYYQVFRKIDKQLPTLTRLDLQTVSPLLNRASDLDLAVPGTYKPGRPIVRIHTFNPVLKVISSKQRPRKLTLYGSDGLDWHFLLKGHEDLRQDERVMQLFGLVNNLLKKDARTRNLDLSIQRYGVIPLSPHSGLIGWVVDSDTLHHLIRDYRQSHHIVLNQEHKDMLEICNDYEKLPVIQKTEVFLEALTKSDGKDVEQILWLRSTNSEIWLMRRSNYTTSLATMSMVGYILGLGDRHPSNLMVDRHTGKIIHIDFGDCFEVAMQREKYPEKIPFRLTRMLINAMEVSGIDGTFRSICEKVMTVLREHSESLVAVLEAFVYDPLLNWRLLPTKEVANPTNGRRTSISQRPPIYNNSLDDEESFSYSISSSSSVNTFDRGANDEMVPQDVSNQRAVSVINRIKMKLSGRDFNGNDVLDVTKQVDNLIDQATSVQNLCQCYVGWCPFW
uniref:non-specific serine/threonine protein kinase n=1 Tax=Arcella intermedia TaxID=1963864 RepID=A0A6B2KZN8_9EUKA